MTQQTAVEYLFKQYKLTGDISNSQWDKARKMQKEQIIDAYQTADQYVWKSTRKEAAQQYYNKTYKTT